MFKKYIENIVWSVARKVAKSVVEEEIMSIRGVRKRDVRNSNFLGFGQLHELLYGADSKYEKYEVDFNKEDTNEEHIDMLLNHLGLEIQHIDSHKKIVSKVRKVGRPRLSE